MVRNNDLNLTYKKRGSEAYWSHRIMSGSIRITNISIIRYIYKWLSKVISPQIKFRWNKIEQLLGRDWWMREMETERKRVIEWARSKRARTRTINREREKEKDRESERDNLITMTVEVCHWAKMQWFSKHSIWKMLQ